MVQLNKVIIAGNLTRDPELRFFANEKAVANFGLAMNRKYRGNDGEMKEEVTFVDIEAWNKTAELAGQYLHKGRPCLIDGSLKLDQWEDKDGNRRSKLKVVAQSIQFIGGRGDGAEKPPQEATTAVHRSAAGGDDDEPPF